MRVRQLFTFVRAKSFTHVSAIVTVLGVGVGMPIARSEAQSKMPAKAETETEVPHPFLTHMGVPEGVGVFALRVTGLTTRAEGNSEGDFGFHLETGLTKTIGLHIRNDAFRTNLRTEVMLQFAAIMSEDGMSGFAPIIEFEFPTHSGAGSRVESLIGFTTTLANPRMSFNQVFHYNPSENAVEGSAALVGRVAKGVFPVVELLGQGGTGTRAAIGLLAGLKVRVREGISFGIAYQFPLSDRRDFASRVLLQPEFEWGKK